MALMNSPKILFLDEPTSGVDPESRHALAQIIRKLQQDGKTVILTTHQLDEAEALASRIAIMSKGRLIVLGTPEEINARFGEGYHLTVEVAE